jgi:plastocyanin
MLAGVVLGCGLVVPAVAQDSGVIKGKVAFTGDPKAKKYKRTELDRGKDPNCAKEVKKIGSEKYILNKTDPVTVRDVMVWVSSGLPDKTWPIPTEPAVLDQHGCQYKPHVLGVMEGQEVVIRNSDDTNHNIHFLPKVNEEINKTQPKKGMESTIKLVTEAPFHVKCDVHPWMGCEIGVFNHPFFTVTGKDGTFELTGLPAGEYEVTAWHEGFGEKTLKVTVGAGETKEQDFSYP